MRVWNHSLLCQIYNKILRIRISSWVVTLWEVIDLMRSAMVKYDHQCVAWFSAVCCQFDLYVDLNFKCIKDEHEAAIPGEDLQETIVLIQAIDDGPDFATYYWFHWAYLFTCSLLVSTEKPRQIHMLVASYCIAFFLSIKSPTKLNSILWWRNPTIVYFNFHNNYSTVLVIRASEKYSFLFSLTIYR